MKISIVIPTIGSPGLDIINQSLQSALSSDPKIWTQLIIVNNSNNRELTSFLLKSVENDDRVEFLNIEEDLTMAECWNRGLEKVKEDLVLFLHDDDILISKNIDLIDIADIKGYKNFGFQVFGSETWNYIPTKQGLEGICFNTPKLVSTIINTAALRETGGWDNESGYFLDFLTFARLHQKFGSDISQKILGKYRLHASNASAVAKRNQSYGDALPYVLREIFKFTSDEKMRRLVLFSTLSFTYPNKTIKNKILSRLSSFLGLNVWLE